MSDFYDSELENDSSRRYDVGSRDATLQRARPTSRQPPSPSATNYMPFRSRNILDRGPYQWPTSAPSTLQRAGTDDRRSDLYDIARRRRRAGSGAADADRLEDWINGLLTDSTRPTTLRAQSSSPQRSQPTTSAAQRHVVSSKFPRSVLLIVDSYYTPQPVLTPLPSALVETKRSWYARLILELRLQLIFTCSSVKKLYPYLHLLSLEAFILTFTGCLTDQQV